MKGVVFTEFLDMVESRFSLEVCDAIIADANLASGAEYTSVGTYPAGEMFALVGALSARTGVSVPGLLEAFGEHLVGPFATRFPHFFGASADALAFLAGVDSYVHVEVRKLYPDAELPRFDVEWVTPQRLSLTYRSPRGMSDLAMGILRGVGQHYRQPLLIAREALSDDGTVVRFTIERAGA
jgi:hypothetical protein